MKMGNGICQNGFHLIGFTLVLGVVLLAFGTSGDAAPTPDIKWSIGKRDWIDEGLDEFYEATGDSRAISVKFNKDYGLRLGYKYSTEERAFFVLTIVGVGILAGLLACCCCCCLCRRRR